MLLSFFLYVCVMLLLVELCVKRSTCHVCGWFDGRCNSAVTLAELLLEVWDTCRKESLMKSVIWHTSEAEDLRRRSLNRIALTSVYAVSI